MAYGLVPVTINVDTRKFVKGTNDIPFGDRPRLFPPEISVLAMSCVDSNGDAITTFADTDTWELFIDQDFDHDTYEGVLDAGHSGAETSIAVTFSADPGTLNATGAILLRNSAGERERVEYTAVSGTGTGRTFTVAVTLSYTYVAGDYCATEDPLMVISDNDDANVAGDWTALDVDGGKVSMRMDCTSWTFMRKVNEYLAANTTDEEMRVYMEIRRYQSGDSTPTVILQDTVYARSTVADKEGGAVISGGSWSAADARYVRSPANLTTQYRMTYVNAAGEITESSSLTTNANGVLNTTVNYAGLSENTHHNTSDAAAVVVGATYRVKNDNNYWGLIGMTGSGSTVAGGAYVNTFHVYNQGYAMSMYTVDGNKPHVWYTDVGDSHNFSFTEKMRLTPDGALLINTASQVGSEKLGVNGDVYVNGALTATGTTAIFNNDTFYMQFQRSGTGFGYIGSGSQVVSGSLATDFGFQAASNFVIATGGITEAMRINSSQQLLINTTTPYGTEKLGVNGQVYANGGYAMANDDYVYLRGDSTTDGSVRMSYQSADDEIKMEVRLSGTWSEKHNFSMA